MLRKTYRRVLVWECRCERCGRSWESTASEAPARCAKCKSQYWNTPKGSLPIGRPPKKPR